MQVRKNTYNLIEARHNPAYMLALDTPLLERDSRGYAILTQYGAISDWGEPPIPSGQLTQAERESMVAAAIEARHARQQKQDNSEPEPANIPIEEPGRGIWWQYDADGERELID